MMRWYYSDKTTLDSDVAILYPHHIIAPSLYRLSLIWIPYPAFIEQHGVDDEKTLAFLSHKTACCTMTAENVILFKETSKEIN